MLHSFRFAKLTNFFLVSQTRLMEYLWGATPVDHDMLAQLAQYVPQYSNNNNMPQFSNDAYRKSWLTTLAPLPSPSLPLQLPPSCPTHTHSHTHNHPVADARNAKVERRRLPQPSDTKPLEKRAYIRQANSSQIALPFAGERKRVGLFWFCFAAAAWKSCATAFPAWPASQTSLGKGKPVNRFA